MTFDHGIEAVIFDLGRVLIHVDFTRGMFRYRKGIDGASDEQILEQLFRDELFIRFNTGRIDAQDVFRALHEKYGFDFTFDRFRDLWTDVFGPMDGMEDILGQVAEKYPVGLLSDIDPLHWEFCRKNFPMLRRFDRPALSFEIGALKPDPKTYLRAAENVGKPPAACIFIDDRPVNVIGAQLTGMKSLVFRDTGTLRKDLLALNLL